MMSEFVIKYDLSSEAQDRILVETGDKPKKQQEVKVDMVDITPEQRADLVYIGDGSLNVDLSHLKTAVIDKKPYSNETNWKSWLDYEKTTPFECIMTSSELLLKASEYAAVRRELEATAKARVEELKAEIEAKKAADALIIAKANNLFARAEELKGNKEALRALREEMPEEVASHKLDNRAYGNTIASRFYETFIKPIEESEKEAREAEAEAERLDWIEQHGSERLKLAIKYKHPADRIYAIERANFECPGWDIDFYDDAEWDDRTNPPLGELKALVEAIEEATLPVWLVWLRAPGRNQPRDDRYYDYDHEEFNPRPALIMRRFLGKYDLIKTL